MPGEDNNFQPYPEIDRLIHEPARFLIMANLYVIESADFTFLMRQTMLTWGNLSSHLSKLEKAGYVVIDKKFRGKKPLTILYLSEEGRSAFQSYRKQMQKNLDGLPDKPL